ncbi:MAG: SiaB family protein kinase [Defluviitaleaceae bacterium]|nr:SiaB family protein kinase [Defluviitaleaceae bacterium]
MDFNVLDYNNMMSKHNISIVYSGAIWAGGIDGMAELLQRKLDVDDLPLSTSKSIFSVFVEQMHNMLMYSAEKEKFNVESEPTEISKGIFVLGKKDSTYFVKTGNVVTEYSAGILQERIDHLNSLDKQGLKQYFKERSRSENDNPESKGAGIGLIEIARRASSKIDYTFVPYGEGLTYFTMSVEI